MDLKLFDAHSHLYMAQFDTDRGEVLARMQDAGVGSIIIGTNVAESKQALALAELHDFLWASVGLHPNETEVFDAAAFEELARHPKVVAIGECGLDYFSLARRTDTAEGSSGKGQKETFLAQIDLAETVGKPLIIHCRDAHEDMLAVLAERKPQVSVVMHFFTGSGELAQQYLDLGCYLSFPGPITCTGMYDDSIRVCPPEKMLAETDSPFAAPVPNRGKRNEPSYVAEVVKKLATIKGMSTEEAAAHTVQNAKKVFALSLVLAVFFAPAAGVSAHVEYAYPEGPVVSLETLVYKNDGPSVWQVVASSSASLAANAVSGTAGVLDGFWRWFDSW